jgi:hypothetical protein
MTSIPILSIDFETIKFSMGFAITTTISMGLMISTTSVVKDFRTFTTTTNVSQDYESLTLTKG